jgi:hypothetical protein
MSLAFDPESAFATIITLITLGAVVYVLLRMKKSKEIKRIA